MYTISIFISLLFSSGGCKDAYEEIMEMMFKIQPRRGTLDWGNDDMNFTRVPQYPNFEKTYFCDIEYTKQIGASRAEESSYPWIARVVHAPTGNVPMLCSAAAVKEKIFLTAAHCLFSSKVKVVSVLYQGLRLQPKAFVIPSKPTQQLFGDIGLIIVLDSNPAPEWKVLNTIKAERTDDHFNWFESLGLYHPIQRVIGFVVLEDYPNDHQLYMLDKILLSNHLCNKITTMRLDSDDYWVPCYYPCTVADRFNNSEKCKPHLSGLGHVVIDENSTLIGVATWTCQARSNHREYDNELPVGIAIPNSDAYREDLKCAIKIRDDNTDSYEKGYYRQLCLK